MWGMKICKTLNPRHEAKNSFGLHGKAHGCKGWGGAETRPIACPHGFRVKMAMGLGIAV